MKKTTSLDNKMSLLKDAIDKLGETRAKIKKLEVLEESLKDTIFKSRRKSFQGNRFFLLIPKQRAILDKTALQEEYGSSWIKAHSNITHYKTIQITL